MVLKNQIQFRAVGPLESELEERSEAGKPASLVAQRDLQRYYYMLRVSCPKFSEPEASLIVDALNGMITQPETAHLLWAQVQDALEGGLAEKWNVDGGQLVGRLRQLKPFEALAVADAAERFWSGPYTQEGPMVERLRQAGLVK